MDMNEGEQNVHAITQNAFKDGYMFAFECVAQDIKRFAPGLKDPDFIRLVNSRAERYADNLIKAVRGL